MTMHIERLTSEVSVNDGSLALTPRQIDQLVALVIGKLEERAREAQRVRGATEVKRSAIAPRGAGH